MVIMADDLGWNDVAFQNSQNRMYTPNLDRMHRESLNLKNSYVHQVCSPSRAAFMTGRYPFRYGMQASVLSALDNASLPIQFKTLPQHLKEVGYTTKMIGKWHLGFCNKKMTPTARGFDSFFGMYTGKAGYYDHVSKWDGYDLQDDVGPYPQTQYRVAREYSGQYSTHIFSNKAVQILQSHNKMTPLFLFLSYQAVHGPLEVPRTYVDRYCAGVTDEPRKTHCGMGAAMDEGIGNVTAALDRLGYSDNLITLFISDNGGPVNEGSSNWPLRGSKITLWEGGTRVVTLLHSKTYLANAFRDKNAPEWRGLMHAVDWYPTLMKAAGYNTPITGIDGVDNWQAVVGNGRGNREWFVYNINDEKNNSAIRYGNYKLVHNGGGSPDAWYNPPPGVATPTAPRVGKKPEYHLFDLSVDEGEKSDIISQPGLRATVDRMKAELGRYWREMQPSVPYPKAVAGKPQFHNMNWVTGWC